MISVFSSSALNILVVGFYFFVKCSSALTVGIPTFKPTRKPPTFKPTRKPPTIYPTTKPTFEPTLQLEDFVPTLWLKFTGCSNGTDSKLFSIVPADICIPNNKNDYQFFRFYSSDDMSNMIGYDSFNSIESCKAASSGSVNGYNLQQHQFSKECGELSGNGASLVMLDKMPGLTSEENTEFYIENYYSDDSCSNIFGFLVVPLDTCVRDESYMILHTDSNLKVSSEDSTMHILIKSYEAEDKECSFHDGTFQEIQLLEKCTPALQPSAVTSRLGFACGFTVNSNVMGTDESSSTITIVQYPESTNTLLIAVFASILSFLCLIICIFLVCFCKLKSLITQHKDTIVNSFREDGHLELGPHNSRSFGSSRSFAICNIDEEFGLKSKDVPSRYLKFCGNNNEIAQARW
jgi:Sodium:neurotransmitter symporter family